MPRIDPFPWNALPEAHGFEGGLEQALETAEETFALDGLPEILRDLLAVTDSSVGVSSRKPVSEAAAPYLSARLVTRHVEVTVACEPELVAFALTRMLGQPHRPTDLAASASPAILGAWQALVVEVARRLTRGAPPMLEAGPAPTPQATVLDAWVRLDGRSFRLELAVRGRELPQRRIRTDVSVRFELMAGSALLSAAELASLRRGDVVLPGVGWFSPADPRETLVAVSAQQELGFRLQVSDVLRYVGREHLPLENEASAVEDSTKESLIAELPLVIRLEIGSVTLSVRECLALRPGDVVSCGRPPLDRVVLRTAGREVARGELVTIDGEVGVRITELAQGDPDDTRPGGPPVEER